jgi:Transcriptional regulator
MTIEQLQCFLAIEKFLNFSVAADDLCTSQSSLSKHIKALESELGVSLFKRNTRNISLTLAGMDFSIHAKKIVEEYNNMIKSVRKYSTQKTHSISFTSIPVMNQYGITDMITEYKKNHPEVNMYIIEKDTDYVVKSLESQSTDFVIMRDNFVPDGNYKIFPLIDDELVLVVGDSHPFADRECISLAEASNENFIFLGTDTYLYNSCVEECCKAGFTPITLRSIMRVETIRNFVAQGLGVSLMMERIAEYLADPGIRIVRLKEKPSSVLSIVCRNGPLPSISSDFIKYAVDYFNTIICHSKY